MPGNIQIKMTPELRTHIEALQPQEAVAELDLYIASHPDDDEALILRGSRHWALGHRSETINDYLAAQRINPQGKAGEALKAVYSILDFYNKDLFNP